MRNHDMIDHPHRIISRGPDPLPERPAGGLRVASEMRGRVAEKAPRRLSDLAHEIVEAIT